MSKSLYTSGNVANPSMATSQSSLPTRLCVMQMLRSNGRATTRMS